MAEFVLTAHAKYKMNFYRLSEARVKRVIGNPLRVEEGIADDTVAMMQRAGTKTNPYEIWTMIVKSKIRRTASKNSGRQIKIVSAWRYPGLTKPGEALPREIIAELRAAIR